MYDEDGTVVDSLKAVHTDLENKINDIEDDVGPEDLQELEDIRFDLLNAIASLECLR